jgi:pseudouridine-5'-phosphate glycosidase
MANPTNLWKLSDEVAHALRDGFGVVALETTIVVHGLPRPVNLEVAAECEDAVRAAGAIPATIGVLGGVPVIGLSSAEIERLADPAREVVKLSSRDLGVAAALGVDGATTVAGTITLAALAGIKVMATGGLGGVHRDATHSFDESADLNALARTAVMVVASGVKSILDIPATLERLETLGIPVVGYRTSLFPGFYRTDSGYRVEWRVEDPESAALAHFNHVALGGNGMVLANPIDAARQLDGALHEQALGAALSRVSAEHISGKAVTPAMLSTFSERAGGSNLQVNRDLVVANAALAGEIAAAAASALR